MKNYHKIWLIRKNMKNSSISLFLQIWEETTLNLFITGLQQTMKLIICHKFLWMVQKCYNVEHAAINCIIFLSLYTMNFGVFMKYATVNRRFNYKQTKKRLCDYVIFTRCFINIKTTWMKIIIVTRKNIRKLEKIEEYKYEQLEKIENRVDSVNYVFFKLLKINHRIICLE